MVHLNKALVDFLCLSSILIIIIDSRSLFLDVLIGDPYVLHLSDAAPLLPAVLPSFDAAASSLRRSLFSTALHPPDTAPLLRRPPPCAAVPLVADPGTGAARCKLLVSPPSIPRFEILAS